MDFMGAILGVNRRKRKEGIFFALFALFAVEEVVMGVGRFNRRERRERREKREDFSGLIQENSDSSA